MAAAYPMFGGAEPDKYLRYPCSRAVVPLVAGDDDEARPQGVAYNELLCPEDTVSGLDAYFSEGHRIGSLHDAATHEPTNEASVDPNCVCQECGKTFASRSSAARHLLKSCFVKSGRASAVYKCTNQGCGYPIHCKRERSGSVTVQRVCKHGRR